MWHHPVGPQSQTSGAPGKGQHHSAAVCCISWLPGKPWKHNMYINQRSSFTLALSRAWCGLFFFSLNVQQRTSFWLYFANERLAHLEWLAGSSLIQQLEATVRGGTWEPREAAASFSPPLTHHFLCMVSLGVNVFSFAVTSQPTGHSVTSSTVALFPSHLLFSLQTMVLRSHRGGWCLFFLAAVIPGKADRLFSENIVFRGDFEGSTQHFSVCALKPKTSMSQMCNWTSVMQRVHTCKEANNVESWPVIESFHIVWNEMASLIIEFEPLFKECCFFALLWFSSPTQRTSDEWSLVVPRFCYSLWLDYRFSCSIDITASPNSFANISEMEVVKMKTCCVKKWGTFHKTAFKLCFNMWYF